MRGSIFKHKDCHKYTWTQHNTKNGYQLDNISISGKWRGSLLDVKNKRRADIQSDHILLIAEVRLKISKVQQKSTSASRKCLCETWINYPYIKLQNKFKEVATRQGIMSKGRFALALSALGDFNLDGYGFCCWCSIRWCWW